MEGFLNFLSNNYLYFLIAAGVLVFALIGFLVDMKRKNKDLEDISVPEVVVDDQPIASVENITSPAEVLNISEEIGNPAPPMPTISNGESETVGITSTPAAQPVINPDARVADDTIEELK